MALNCQYFVMKYTVKIKDNKDFVTLYKKGKYTVGKFVAVYYKKNSKNRTGLGITTGKKIGNAVVRSRCRRIIRAAYYECENEFPKGYDYIISARADCKNAKSTDIAAFFRSRVIPTIKKSTENNFANSNKNIKNNK